jgi:hypothetical protein
MERPGDGVRGGEIGDGGLDELTGDRDGGEAWKEWTVEGDEGPTSFARLSFLT